MGRLETVFQIARLIGWVLSTGMMFSVVYGLYPGNLTVPLSSVYAALGHTAWAIGVSFIVIQCCTGSATMIDSLLSLRLIYPLSRLTYCAYLVHPIIMLITASQMDGPLHLHNDIVVRFKKMNLKQGIRISLGWSRVNWRRSILILFSLYVCFSSWSCTSAIWSPLTWCRSAFQSRSRRR